MFSVDQIFPVKNLIENFTKISNTLYLKPQALLITQASNEPLVLVNAIIYERLLSEHYAARLYQDLGGDS